MLKASASPGCVPAIAVCPFALLVVIWRIVVATRAVVVGHWREESRAGSLLQSERRASMWRCSDRITGCGG